MEAAWAVAREAPGALPDVEPAFRIQMLNDVGVRCTVAVRCKRFEDQFVVRHELFKRLDAAFTAAGHRDGDVGQGRSQKAEGIGNARSEVGSVKGGAMRRGRLAGVIVAVLAVTALAAQEREDRTLLSQQQMTAIINEASGERAMHHVLELVPYPRVRPPEEYNGHFRESEVMAKFAKEYGFSNVAIEAYQQGGQTWQPTQGELWMTTPKTVKLFDIHDIAISLASLNANGDITGELVDVNLGRAAGLRGQGRHGQVRRLRRRRAGAASTRQAVQRGAIGVLGVSAIGYQRADDYPNQIVSTTVNAQPNTVAWAVTPEAQRKPVRAARARPEDHDPVASRRACRCRARQEIVHAEIPGDGSTTQEVAISGHLYEGVIKQGANDDNSGCALTLEIGRAYLKLINEGKLPRPKRTINFHVGAGDQRHQRVAQRAPGRRRRRSSAI